MFKYLGTLSTYYTGYINPVNFSLLLTTLHLHRISSFRLLLKYKSILIRRLGRSNLFLFFRTFSHVTRVVLVFLLR